MSELQALISVNIRVPRQLLNDVDAIRYWHAREWGEPTRTDAIRLILERAIAEHEQLPVDRPVPIPGEGVAAPVQIEVWEQLSARLPKSMVDTIDAIAAKMDKPWGRPTRTDAIRMLLFEGCRAIGVPRLPEVKDGPT